LKGGSIVSKKLVCLMSLVLVFGMAGGAPAVDVYWDGGLATGGTDNLWSTPNNWDPNGVPTTEAIYIAANDGNLVWPVVNSTVPTIDSWVRMGWYAYNQEKDVELTIGPGGVLHNKNYWNMGNQTTETTATLNINGGTFINDGEIHVGYQNANAVINMTDNAYLDTLRLTIIYGTWYEDEVINGTVNLYSGTIDIKQDLYIEKFPNPGPGPGVAHGELNIWDGVVKIDGESDNVQVYLSKNKIRAYNGEGTILYDFDVSNPGQTTIWAIPDFDGSNDVNLADFAYLANDWEKTGADLTTDISGPNGVPDDVVNGRDLATFAKYYLEE